MPLILAIDQGTTNTTALIMNEHAQVIAKNSIELSQSYTKQGFIEHEAKNIRSSVEKAVRSALEIASLKKHNIDAIAITNQRETTCLFDKNSEALLPFIVWQCRRSADICSTLQKEDFGTYLHKTTGLHVDPYFSATKLKWLFDKDPALRQKAQNAQLLFGTIDSYLAHWFSGGALHISDISNASRTMLMNLATAQWDESCLEIFNAPKNCLPRIVKNIGPYGQTRGLSFLADGIPITSMIGDQQAALIGQACLAEGEAKATFGTGSFILQNIGKKIVYSNNGLLTSVAYQVADEPLYCLEGSAFIAGAAVQFVRDNLCFIKDAKDIEALASSVADSNGVSFVPALCGLGAPFWRPQAHGAILGLSRSSTKAHIARAVLESIALQNACIIEAMADDKRPIRFLKVDGGAAQNNLLMQIQADFLGVLCQRDRSVEKTALGTAYLSLLALGVFKSIDEIRGLNEKERQFTPKLSIEERQALLIKYKKAAMWV